MDASLSAIAVLIDDMRSETAEIRISALKQTDAIARALGPVRTREELIPFLLDMIDDEQEVLLALVNALTSVADLVGGLDHVGELLKALELLCTVEDVQVRESALHAMAQIIQTAPDVVLLFDLQPLIIRLSVADWHVARSTAAFLIVHAFIRLSSKTTTSDTSLDSFTQTLLTHVNELSKDETPMVRRSTALATAVALSRASTPGPFHERCLGILRDACTDEDEAVKCVVPTAVGQIFSSQPFGSCHRELGKSLRHIIHKISSDSSWRVRQACINALPVWFAAANGHAELANTVHQAYLTFLADSDGDVKAQAVAKLPEFFHWVNAVEKIQQERKTQVVALLESIANDPSVEVRLSLMESLQCAENWDPKEFAQICLPRYLKLVTDPVISIKMRALNSLPKFLPLIDERIVTEHFLILISELLSERNWRARAAAIGLAETLVNGTSSDIGLRKAHPAVLIAVEKWFRQWLNDNVFSVREAAAAGLARFCKAAGDTWTKSHAWPIVDDLIGGGSYISRATGVSTLAAFIQYEVIVEEASEKLAVALEDKVANVRLAAVQAASLVESRNTTEWNKLKSKISHLARDTDPTVSSLASRLTRT